jgi:hypothetical protein
MPYNCTLKTACYQECPRLVSDQREPDAHCCFEKAI